MRIKINKAIGFNSCIREGYIPTMWKSALISPISKVHPPQNLQKDLRPISLTPVTSKQLEFFLYKWLIDCVHDKIDPLQFGALKGSSTVHALVHMLHDWYLNTDNSSSKQFIWILLIDYSKAFDRINPLILIDKLKALQVPDVLLNVISSFLTGRRQRVKIGKNISDWLEIWGNTPQGTLLGVLLFLLMINDLSLNLPTFKFVDDTTTYNVTNDENSNALQVAANQVYDWSCLNDMKINESKTKEIVVCFRKEPVQLQPLSINGIQIEQVSSAKLLGLIVSDDLAWQTHVDYIVSKASKRIYFIIVLKRSGLSAKDLVTVYSTTIRPILKYAAPVWHSSLTKQQTDSIEHVQKRVLKIVFNCPYEEGLVKSGLTTLHDRREQLIKDFFIKMQDPNHKLNKLLPSQKTCGYSTRSTKKFEMPKCKTKRFKNSFIPALFV